MPNVIVLEPGQSVIIPPGMTINSIIVNQGATLETDCDNLPDPDEYVCIRYNFAFSDAGNPAALQDITVDSITIGGATYDFNFHMVATSVGGVSNIMLLKDTINNAMGAVFKVYSASSELNAFSDRFEFALAVKVPSSLKDSIIFKMSGTGYPNPPGFNLLFSDQPDCGCVDPTNKEEYFCDINL